MAQIGLDNLVYAVMTDIDAETYGTVKTVKGIKSADINPRTSTVSDYSDDVLTDTVESLEGIDLTIENKDVPTEVMADWHGHTVDSKGVLVKTSNDIAPYIAIGFRSLKSDGKYRYKWLFKCKGQLGQETAKTKAEKVEFQSKTTQFTCMPRLRDKQWEATANEGDTGLGAEVITNWFKAPYGETVSQL
ncbi:hypothetical protein PBV87_11500 [Niameybacter massiliensis]|uniref:Phage tail protein n=1 Tax=Holtiella tumoricola TaxID=3018743 RepID=A0AA42J1D0_9FIRM|nr:major tail protein [Holtiella tumoricola]MDA3732108.1 hypothetical protein [Holtiella tumoricola]